MVKTEWIEHRRGRDGERLGWICPEDEGFVAIDLLGQRRTDAVDWVGAEEALDSLGIGYLADRYELFVEDDRWLPVRISEVAAETVTVSEDHGPAIEAPRVDYSLQLPLTGLLRPVE